MKQTTEADGARIDVNAIKRSASVDKIEWTNYDDIVLIHFNGGSQFRVDNFESFMGDYEVSHVDFDARVVEYTKKQ